MPQAQCATKPRRVGGRMTQCARISREDFRASQAARRRQELAGGPPTALDRMFMMAVLVLAFALLVLVARFFRMI